MGVVKFRFYILYLKLPSFNKLEYGTCTVQYKQLKDKFLPLCCHFVCLIGCKRVSQLRVLNSLFQLNLKITQINYFIKMLFILLSKQILLKFNTLIAYFGLNYNIFGSSIFLQYHRQIWWCLTSFLGSFGFWGLESLYCTCT